MTTTRLLLASALLAISAAATAADPAPRKPVLDLFNALPSLPATANDAAKWVGKNGALVHPGFLALKADIEAHKRGMESVAKAAAVKDQSQAAIQVENLSKGMADVGIDMERMKTDPAYAQQMQEKMKKMTPAELMAMAQTMNKPMNNDPRLQNQAKLMVEDSAVVKEASAAGSAYADGQLARVNAHHQLWTAQEQTAKTLNAKPVDPGMKKPATPYDSPACNNACLAEWDAYAGKVLPLLVARDTEVLQAHRAAFDKERAAAAVRIKEANRHLLATQYGASARSQAHRTCIMGYNGAAIGEIELLMSRMEEVVKRAALRANCGKQVVLAPQAVCYR